MDTNEQALVEVGAAALAAMAALDVGDVQAEADGSGRLFVGASKTDQEGRGAPCCISGR